MEQIYAIYDKKCHRWQKFSILELLANPTNLILAILALF